ncbi:MAG TPA: hypothetical protein VFL76_07465 [Edaphocola sp.]|nr:hypothetical protein [Edaphocola sp.]
MKFIRKNIIGLAALGLALALWTSCNKDEQVVSPPLPGNEFMTTVKLIAVNANDPSDADTASWVDLDPAGSRQPDLSNAFLDLKANATYNVQLQFWDESKTPAEDITPEIKERANYHLICFTPQGGLNLTVNRTDHDGNNPPLPVGLQDNFVTGAASSGDLNVKLRHQPNVKDGTCDPGSTDADVDFQINIQ